MGAGRVAPTYTLHRRNHMQGIKEGPGTTPVVVAPVDVSGETPLLSFRDAVLGYGHRVVLRDVTLDFQEGDFLGIVGPNGSGKTTLIKTALGLLRPLGGTVAITAPGGRLRFGYAPQRDTVDTVFPLRVRDIVGMGRYGRVGLFRRLGQADWEAVDQALERVGIADLARRGSGE